MGRESERQTDRQTDRKELTILCLFYLLCAKRAHKLKFENFVGVLNTSMKRRTEFSKKK